MQSLSANFIVNINLVTFVKSCLKCHASLFKFINEDCRDQWFSVILVTKKRSVTLVTKKKCIALTVRLLPTTARPISRSHRDSHAVLCVILLLFHKHNINLGVQTKVWHRNRCLRQTQCLNANLWRNLDFVRFKTFFWLMALKKNRCPRVFCSFQMLKRSYTKRNLICASNSWNQIIKSGLTSTWWIQKMQMWCILKAIMVCW